MAENATILDGEALAKKLREEIRVRTAEFENLHGITPHLAVVLVGLDPASKVYVGSKQKACERAGIKSTRIDLPASATADEIVEQIQRLNLDSTVHGILLQLPLPKGIDERAVLAVLDPRKDVDGLHVENMGLLAIGRPRFIPCTPLGVLKILEAYDISTRGKRVTIVGRSLLVGRPLSLLLSERGPSGDATVTVCHAQTKDLVEHTRNADILIVATGKPKMIDAAMVKLGAVVIDVGINRLDDGTIVGDVDFASVKEVASAITPVPKGIGPLTVTMLLENTLSAAWLSLS